MKYHTGKFNNYVTPRTIDPAIQRRGRIYFEFEHHVAKGRLRGNWEDKAILLEEYLSARGERCRA